jgi:hypothetical protein
VTTSREHHHPHPAAFRARAQALRSLANELERTPVMSLDQDAGPDTWQSPRADVCRWVLGVNQAQLRRAIEELRWNARSLESQALELEHEQPQQWGAS